MRSVLVLTTTSYKTGELKDTCMLIINTCRKSDQAIRSVDIWMEHVTAEHKQVADKHLLQQQESLACMISEILNCGNTAG
jgi:hypothetical protein